MFSSPITRYVMAMKFRKISTMFFKKNYGFVIFFMKILPFSSQACSGYNCVKSAILDLNILLSHPSWVGVLSFLCSFLIFIYFVMSVAPQDYYPKRLKQPRYPMMRIQKFHIFSCHWKFEGINKKRCLKSWNVSTDGWWAIEFGIYSLLTLSFFRWYFRFS